MRSRSFFRRWLLFMVGRIDDGRVLSRRLRTGRGAWRGGSVTYKQYLSSEKWAVLSRQAKKRSLHRCQLCNRAGELHAHHRTYERLGDEDDADITVLCRDCHARHHGKVESMRECWLRTVHDESPLVYNLFLAQADSTWIGEDGVVWVLFGSTALDEIVGSFDGRVVSGRTVRVIKSLRPTSCGLTPGPDPDEAAVPSPALRPA